MNYNNILIVLVFVQTTALVIALLTRKQKNSLSNYILSTLLIIFAYNDFLGLLLSEGIFYQYPVLVKGWYVHNFLIGPAVYFYAVSITLPDFAFKKRDLRHLIPACLAILAAFSHLLLDDVDPVNYVKIPLGKLGIQIVLGLHLISALAYLVAGVRVIVAFKKVINNVFSTNQDLKINWLFIFYGMMGVTWVVAFWRWQTGLNPQYVVVDALISTLLLYGITIYALMNSRLFLLGRECSEVIPDRIAYEKSALKPTDIKLGVEKIETYLHTEKAYSNCDLTMKDLAQALKMPSYQLSQIINSGLGMNFYRLINNYRIEEAKKMLVSKQHKDKSVLDIAFEAGFNSKSTFNTAFKSLTGVTPTAYRSAASGNTN